MVLCWMLTPPPPFNFLVALFKAYHTKSPNPNQLQGDKERGKERNIVGCLPLQMNILWIHHYWLESVGLFFQGYLWVIDMQLPAFSSWQTAENHSAEKCHEVCNAFPTTTQQLSKCQRSASRARAFLFNLQRSRLDCAFSVWFWGRVLVIHHN